MGIVLYAIPDALTADVWLCPRCFEPLDCDGIWQEGDGLWELWACHDCALEYSRDAGSDEPLRAALDAHE